MSYVVLCLIFILIFLLIFGYLIVPINKNYPKKKNNNGKYCILIPARNESKVIEGLLTSIKEQTRKIDASDVYIIVEDPKDPTIEIDKKYKMNIVFRKDLSKKRKGYALDDAIQEILKDKKKYDAYFILDADNVLDKDFIKIMEEDINLGYDIGIGYRNTKNGDSLVACSSALAFSLTNTLNNERNKKYTNTCSISGTGFYIRGEIIEKLKGYPFNSLTEDYELSLYCTLNNLTTTYNKKAIFYDEQPDSFKTSITQRTRWVKGYFEARKNYAKDIRKSIKRKDINFSSKINALIGITPLILIFISTVLFLLNASFISFKTFAYSLILVLAIYYFSLFLLSYSLIKKEKDKLNIKVSIIKLMLYNPIFLSTFIYCFLIAIFKKNIEWKAIPHDKQLKL